PMPEPSRQRCIRIADKRQAATGPLPAPLVTSNEASFRRLQKLSGTLAATSFSGLYENLLLLESKSSLLSAHRNRSLGADARWCRRLDNPQHCDCGRYA